MKRAYTIVLPLRNGGEYLKECVTSILAQTYTNFEIAVLENNSSDNSVAWLQSLCEDRIKIYPAEHDLSIEQNWGRARLIPRQDWMTFIGHDDQLAPDFLEVIDGLIEANPDASLYQTHFHYIDEKGVRTQNCAPFPAREKAHELLAGFLTNQRESYSGFVMRSADYDAVGGIPTFPKLLWADHALWISLTHKSWKAASAQQGFALRQHTRSTAGSADWRSLMHGMSCYIEFLQKLRLQDPEVDAVCHRYGDAYFLSHCRLFYLLALVRATKQNQRVDPDVLSEISVTLALWSPELVPSLPCTRTLRMREVINRVPLRWVYRTYIRAFYGPDAL
jgi:GT2 family glycosyltransferase